MIEINLIGRRKKKFVLPNVLGMDLNLIKIPYVIGAIIFSYIPGYFLTQSHQRNMVLIKTEITGLEKTQKKFKAQLKDQDEVREMLEAYQLQIEKLKNRSKQVEKIIREKTNPKFILEKIARIIPENLWLEKLEFRNNNISLTGATTDYTTLGSFLTTLNETPFFTNNLSLPSTKTVKRTYDGVEVRVEQFEIQGRVTSFDPFME